MSERSLVLCARHRFVLGILLCSIVVSVRTWGISPVPGIDLSFFTTEKSKNGPELNLSEEGYWRTKHEQLEEAYRRFKDEYQKKKRDLAGRKERVNASLAQLEQEEGKSAYKEKKVGFLQERLLKFEVMHELLATLDELYQKNVLFADEMMQEARREPLEAQPILYATLKDERMRKEELAKLQQQEHNEKRNSERLEKQKRLEQERKTAVEEEIAECKMALRGEDQAFVSTILSDPENLINKAEREDLLNVKFALLNDQREVIELSIRKLDLQLQRSEMVQLQHAKEVKEARKSLVQTERQLRITPLDVETAKQELEQERMRAARVLKQVSDLIISKKKEREALRARREALESQRRLYKELVQKDPVKEYSVDLKLNVLDEQLRTLDQEIDLLNDQKNSEEEKVAKKTRYVRYVDLRHKAYEGELYHEDIEALMSDTKREEKKYRDEIEVLEEQRNELTHLGIEIQQKKDKAEKLNNELRELQNTLFRNRAREYQEAEAALDSMRKAIIMQMSINPKHISMNLELSRFKKEVLEQEELIRYILEREQHFDVWERSPNAIKWEGFKRSLKDAELFLRNFFWRLPHVLSITSIMATFSAFSWIDYLSLLGLIILFIVLFWGTRRVLRELRNALVGWISRQSLTIIVQAAHLVAIILDVILRYYVLWFCWIFVLLSIGLGDSVLYPFQLFKAHFELEWRRNFVVTIYFLSIPILMFFTSKFMVAMRELNRWLDFAFFSERYEAPFSMLIAVILYVSSILLPLRSAFIAHVGPNSESIFPSVIMAAYTLMLQFVAVAFVFFHKEDLLNLITTDEGVLGWIKHSLDRYYYPIFLFFLVLLTLSNPYVGYTNLAYKLLLAAPLTLMIVYSVFLAHYYVRRYSAYWFIYEEEGEVVGRFDHAKTYYGIFIILTFLLFIFIAAMVIGWIWGLEATFERVHYLLSQQWTLPLGPDKHIGIIQLVVFILFIAIGFLTSTLMDKFVLSKIFDVLQMDPGIRNTVSSIFHYVIIYFILVLGLNYIQLGDFVFYITSILAIGIGFGMQPFLHDFLAGLLILLERPVEIGNFVETGGTRGTVQKISPRSVTIRTFLNHLVVVPNKELITKPIINWGYGRSTVGFDMRIQVSYSASPEEVVRVLEGVLQSDSRVLRVPAVVYRLDEFSENGMIFLVRAHISARRVRQQWDIAGELRTKIYWAFKASNIKMPYPHRVVHFSNDPNVHFGKDQGSISIKFDGPGIESEPSN